MGSRRPVQAGNGRVCGVAGVCVWAGMRVRRKAFSSTVSELSDMPMAAQIGVIQPSAAKGSISPLYRPAHSILFDDQDPQHTAAVEEAKNQHPESATDTDKKAPPHV